jgi:uncharacterized membrane protein
MNEQQFARTLGWFSIGLGLAELVAPRRIGRTLGLRNHHAVLRSAGMRELASGVGILSRPNPPPAAVWSRVAGDLMDLAMLGAAAHSHRSARKPLAIALVAVGTVMALDILCSAEVTRADARRQRMRNLPGVASFNKRPIRKSITINRPAEEIYAFWRNFENLPRFMNHLKSVTTSIDGRSHWVAKGPMNTQVEWDAEIINEVPNQLIAWRSLPGSAVTTAGTVRFERATGGRGTVVRVDLQYRPPGGAIGATIAKLFGESPEKQIAVDLHRIKQLLETGEIARTEGQPAGRARSTSRRFDDFVRV